MKNLIANKIKEIINEQGFDAYGLRVVPEKYNIGDEIPHSAIWEDDGTGELRPTDDIADGACAFDAENKNFDIYIDEFIDGYGDQGTMYLIGGDKVSGGDMCHHVWEIMIREPEVLAIVK